MTLNPLTTNLQMTQVSVNPAVLGNLPVYANWEYTNGSVANAYAANVQAFVNIFNLGSTTATDGTVTPNPVTPALQAAIIAAIYGNPPTGAPTAVTSVPSDTAGLTTLLTNKGLLGLSQTMVENPPGSKKYYGLTVSMANNLDQLLRSLVSAGWDPSTGAAGITVDVLNRWRDLSILSPTIQGVLSGAVGAVQANRSLQSTIETVYVATANDLISGKLSDLEQQLSNSQDVLDSLASIQNIHNQIVVSGKGSINFVYNVALFNNDDGDFAEAYARAASAHFGQPIIPHVPSSLVTYGTPPLTGQLAVLAQQQNELRAQIQAGLDIINAQFNQMESIGNLVIEGKTVSQRLADYNLAAKNYALAIDQPGDLSDAQVIAAQQTYLNAANEFNRIFWNSHIWPPTNTTGSSSTPPSLATNPVSALKNFSTTQYTLTATYIDDPLAIPPVTHQLSSAEATNIAGTQLDLNTPMDLGEYISQSITLYRGVLRNNYNNFVNVMNDKIEALNAQIAAYNDANPTLSQLSEQSDLALFADLPAFTDDVDENSYDLAAINSPAPDGSQYYHPINSAGTGLEGRVWSNYLNDVTGNGQGAGLAYPGTVQQETPFSAVPDMFGGNHGDDFRDNILANIRENATLPTFNHSNTGAPVVNTVQTFGFYDQEGRPILTPQALTAKGQGVLNDLLEQRQKLLDQITFLETVTPKITNANGDLTFDPNSLLVKLRNVIDDMNNTLSANGVPLTQTSPDNVKMTAFVNWILDNYDKTDDASTSKQGEIQQTITFAITAAQSSNDSQKTKVQQFMFIFEEYYKSAAAILTKITEIIEKIAQGIAR